jgi:hypothetical protein
VDGDRKRERLVFWKWCCQGGVTDLFPHQTSNGALSNKKVGKWDRGTEMMVPGQRDQRVLQAEPREQKPELSTVH